MALTKRDSLIKENLTPESEVIFYEWNNCPSLFKEQGWF